MSQKRAKNTRALAFIVFSLEFLIENMHIDRRSCALCTCMYPHAHKTECPESLQASRKKTKTSQGRDTALLETIKHEVNHSC